jgi:O-antigen/teichoic acid export membrane protein
MSDKEKEHGMKFLIRKSSYALFFRIGSFAAAYLFMLVTARSLGPATWGSFTLAFTVVQVLAIFSLWGLDNLIVRSLARIELQDKKSLAKVYFQSLAVVVFFSLVFSSLLYFTSDIVASQLFKKPALSPHLKTAAVLLIFWSLIMFHSSCFRGLKNMTGFTVFRMAVYGIAALLMYSFIRINIDELPVSVFTLSSLLVMIVSMVSWFRFSGIRFTDFSKPSGFLPLLQTSTPMLITGSVFFILGWADNIFLGIFKTEYDVGIYDAAFKIAAAPAMVLVAINAIQAPVFSDLFHRGEMNKLKASVEKGSKLLFYTSVPVCLFIWLFPSFLLGIFGEQFKTGSAALIILAGGSLVNALTGSVGVLLQMTGRQKEYNYIVITAAGINIALNIILIPAYGIIGAAIASASSIILQNIAAAFYVYKVYNFATVFIPFFKRQKSSGISA